MSIKNDFQKVKEKHNEALEISRLQIKASIEKVMDDFTEATGFIIKTIDMDMIAHYSGKVCNISLITGINIKTDMHDE